MNSKYNIDMLLKYLASIYIQNPNFPINENTIYEEIELFNVDNNCQYRINKTNLVPIQLGVARFFQNNCWSDDYYLVFENRINSDDKSFYESISNGIKLYISVDEEQLYLLTINLFNFLLSQGIKSQGTIAKEMKNNVLAVSVTTKEDALKVSNYINTLTYLDNDKRVIYNPKVHSNPFVLKNGNIGIVKEEKILYDYLLSKFLRDYLIEKRQSNTLQYVSSEDFKLFLQRILYNRKNIAISYNYPEININHDEFTNILNMIIGNIDGTLTIESLFSNENINQNNNNYNSPTTQNYEVMEETKEEVKRIIWLLVEKYNNLGKNGIDETHKRLADYFNTGNINHFTRDYNIRNTIQEKYPPFILKKIVLEIGFDALMEASFETINRHGFVQLENAIKILFGEINGMQGITGFTNYNYARSKLGYLISIPLLQEVIKEKTKEKKFTFSSELAAQYIYECLQERQISNVHNRS